MKRRVLGLCVILWVAVMQGDWHVATADLQMPEIFADHMVLQREIPVPVWGREESGGTITVEFGGQKKTATADTEGKWIVKLNPMPASTNAQTMIITSSIGNRKWEIKDILVGEVWLGSGQSNMYMPIGKLAFSEGVIGGKDEIARPEQAELRLYCNANHKEWKDAGLSCWQRANSTSRPPFSSTAYFFGNAIQSDLKVPVGVINISAGGSPISSWTPKDATLQVPIVQHYHELYQQNKVEIEKHNALMNHYQEVWRQRNTGGVAAALNPPPTRPEPLTYNLNMATRFAGGCGGLYESYIAPIVPFALRGVIWYQGEANADNLDLSLNYEEMLRALITSWREKWGQPKLPFYFVQLPCWDNNEFATTWHVNRQGMLNVLRSMPDVGMVVTADVGDIHNLHPPNKRPVGERLALWALAKTYGKSLVYSGPLVRRITAENDTLRIDFDTCGSVLKVQGPAWADLEVAGEDGLYYPAKATIRETDAVVSSSAVLKPVAVRYGWKSVFTPTLFNREGLPASPFSLSVTAAGI